VQIFKSKSQESRSLTARQKRRENDTFYILRNPGMWGNIIYSQRLRVMLHNWSDGRI